MVEVLNTIFAWLAGFWVASAMLVVIKTTIVCLFIYLIFACIAKWGG